MEIRFYHGAADAKSGTDAYHALEKTGGLIITGATGTNVNDVSVLLIGRQGACENREN